MRTYIIIAVIAILSALVVLLAPIFLLPEFEKLTFYLVFGSMIALAGAMLSALYVAWRETELMSSPTKVDVGDLQDYAEMYMERRSK